MTRAYFYIDRKTHQALAREVAAKGGSLSEFVREAVQEKLDRDRALENSHQVKDELADLVDELRAEIAQMRRTVADDAQRSMALIREDVGKSIRKTEEYQKTFLVALGGTLKAQVPAKASSRRDDDGPRAIPG